MKLETSEEDIEWVRKRVDYIRSQGGPFILDDRVYCDFLTLLAEVERLKADRRPFSDGLAQKVIDEQVKTIDRLTANLAERAPPLPAEVEEMRKSLLSYAANIAAADDMPHLPKTVQAMRDAASLLSRWPGGFFAGLSEEQKKAALEYRGPENFGEPDAPLLPEPPHE
mgnify:CR=1 FL=1